MRLTSALLGAACAMTSLALPANQFPNAGMRASAEEPKVADWTRSSSSTPNTPPQMDPILNEQHVARQKCIQNRLILSTSIVNPQTQVNTPQALSTALGLCGVPAEYYSWYLKKNFPMAAGIVEHQNNDGDVALRQDAQNPDAARRRSSKGNTEKYPMPDFPQKGRPVQDLKKSNPPALS
ncbi:MAG: hypothetical protein M1823_003355 [Watsoniomyces obsoletus]|nr:MAG: hypothetical protein M1823_003355 [Watsoniomyces obsoletus]